MVSNNSWIADTKSPTVVVFVHGILSSSDSCWFNRNTGTFWPKLVADDPDLAGPSVFVSGYTAGIGSGLIDIYDAAEQVMLYLEDGGKRDAPLRRSQIVFVCHSQGGIVVRQMLLSNTDKFSTKKVGLVLCGSPSWGSFWGTALLPLTLLLRFRQATALRWAAPSLVRLDRDFFKMLGRKRIPDIAGLSLIETKSAIPLLPSIVSEASATRYFPDWQRILGSHGQIVKPDGPKHLSHKYLVSWMRQHGFVPDDQLAESQVLLQGTVEPPLPQEDFDIAGNDFSDSVDRYFVGRRQFRDDFSRLCDQLDTQGGSVYWLHGIGGLGKSFFLRRVFLDTPHNMARCLVDWDDATNRYRLPLRNRPRSIVDVFDAIAHSFEKIVGSASLDSYRSASTAVRKSQGKRAQLERRFDSTIESLVAILKASAIRFVSTASRPFAGSVQDGRRSAPASRA